jgi:hypothetical protein
MLASEHCWSLGNIDSVRRLSLDAAAADCGFAANHTKPFDLATMKLL